MVSLIIWTKKQWNINSKQSSSSLVPGGLLTIVLVIWHPEQEHNTEGHLQHTYQSEGDYQTKDISRVCEENVLNDYLSVDHGCCTR
jgi:hypothetical protein